jgi:hypothetical protein
VGETLRRAEGSLVLRQGLGEREQPAQAGQAGEVKVTAEFDDSLEWPGLLEVVRQTLRSRAAIHEAMVHQIRAEDTSRNIGDEAGAARARTIADALGVVLDEAKPASLLTVLEDLEPAPEVTYAEMAEYVDLLDRPPDSLSFEQICRMAATTARLKRILADYLPPGVL